MTSPDYVTNVYTQQKSFEDATYFKYMGMTIEDQNYIHEEIKNRLNSGNSCYYAFCSLVSSCLLSGNINPIIFLGILYVCQTSSQVMGRA
jgi:hypothetical protein